MTAPGSGRATCRRHALRWPIIGLSNQPR
jgi:hypothetical protein